MLCCYRYAQKGRVIAFPETKRDSRLRLREVDPSGTIPNPRLPDSVRQSHDFHT